jgi:hypothetical protein
MDESQGSAKSDGTGCLLRGLRVVFLISIIIVLYMLMLVPVLVAGSIWPSFAQEMSGQGAVVVIFPALILSVVATVFIARRFRDVPVRVMVGAIVLAAIMFIAPLVLAVVFDTSP